MDPVSQVALGAAVSIAALGRRTPTWKAALWGGLCGLAPDLDIFIDHGDPIADMTRHRAETHAILYLTLASVPVGLAAARLHGEIAHFGRWWLAAWLALVTHPLLDAAAEGGVSPRIRLISPTATETLQQWAAEGRIEWEARPYAAGDLFGARLVFAATSEREVNAAIAQEAAAVGALCNVADAPEEGDFHVPAVLRTEEALIAVSTGGTDPRRAVSCRNRIRSLLSQAESH